MSFRKRYISCDDSKTKIPYVNIMMICFRCFCIYKITKENCEKLAAEITNTTEFYSTSELTMSDNEEVIDLHSMKMAELKEELKSRQLPVSGAKAQLIERLENYMQEHEGVEIVEEEESQEPLGEISMNEWIYHLSGFPDGTRKEDVLNFCDVSIFPDTLNFDCIMVRDDVGRFTGQSFIIIKGKTYTELAKTLISVIDSKTYGESGVKISKSDRKTVESVLASVSTVFAESTHSDKNNNSKKGRRHTKTKNKNLKTNLLKVKILDLELLNSCRDIQIENLKFQLEMANARSQKLMSVAHIMKNEFLKEKTRLIGKYETDIKSRDKDSKLLAEVTDLLIDNRNSKFITSMNEQTKIHATVKNTFDPSQAKKQKLNSNEKEIIDLTERKDDFEKSDLKRSRRRFVSGRLRDKVPIDEISSSSMCYESSGDDDMNQPNLVPEVISVPNPSPPDQENRTSSRRRFVPGRLRDRMGDFITDQVAVEDSAAAQMIPVFIQQHSELVIDENKPPATPPAMTSSDSDDEDS